MDDRAARDRAVVWELVSQIVDGVEAELDLVAAGIEHRVLARIKTGMAGRQLPSRKP
jgi:hypothetical protein